MVNKHIVSCLHMRRRLVSVEQNERNLKLTDMFLFPLQSYMSWWWFEHGWVGGWWLTRYASFSVLVQVGEIVSYLSHNNK